PSERFGNPVPRGDHRVTEPINVIPGPNDPHNQRSNRSSPNRNSGRGHHGVQPFKRVLEPINSTLNFHDNRVSCHRSKHGTNSSLKMLLDPRLLTTPPDNAAEGFTDPFPEILDSRGNILHPVIKTYEEVFDIRPNIKDQLFNQLANRRPSQRHRTREC